MQAERFFVSGRVQGVGFRYAARHRARELGLTGYVRNLPDGRVEALVQGDQAKIDAFAQWLQRGPPLAQVDDLQRAPAAIEETTVFGFG
jgi:acylphosphatase